jgi:hypothetical protein
MQEKLPKHKRSEEEQQEEISPLFDGKSHNNAEKSKCL